MKTKMKTRALFVAQTIVVAVAIIYALLSMTGCKKEEQPEPEPCACDTCPPQSQPDTRPKATWTVVVLGSPGEEYAYWFYDSYEQSFYCMGVAPDTFTVRIPVDENGTIMYEELSGTVNAVFFRTSATDTLKTTYLPATRL